MERKQAKTMNSKISGKIFLAIFIIAIAARLFSFALLPESAYTDSLYHLSVIEGIIQNNPLPETTFLLQPPLFYALSSGFFLVTGLPVEVPFVRIIPIALTIALLFAAFKLFQLLFKNNYLAALSFVAISPWLIRYGTVNYLEPFAAIFVITSIYFFKRFLDSTSFKSLGILFISLLALSLSKLDIAIMLPPLFIAFAIWHLWKTKHLSRLALPFAVFSIILIAISGFYAYNYFTIDINPLGQGLGSGNFDALYSYVSFYDFPPLDSFSRIPFLSQFPLLASELIFILLTLPITIAILLGFAYAFRSRQDRAFNLLLLALFLLPVLRLLYGALNSQMWNALYMRYLIPIIPVCAIFFAYGYLHTKNISLRRLLFLSFSLFALYSLFFTSISALFYSQTFSDHKGLYEFASKFPDSAKLHSEEQGRAIEFYSQKTAASVERIYELSPEQIHSALRTNGFTHLVISCYRNPWSENNLNELKNKNFIIEVYSDSCTTIYEIS